MKVNETNVEDKEPTIPAKDTARTERAKPILEKQSSQIVQLH